MKFILNIVFLFSFSIIVGQGIYPPAAGIVGTTALHKDSNVFVSWGNNCKIIRGYQQIDSVSLGFSTNGDSTSALSKADGVTVSLGDKGVAIYSLQQPIFNGVGADFAVFENGFSSNFLELAFVEVSSDGINYFRFPSFSTTQDSIQIGSFGSLDATNIHNLAGKYKVNYGTPFDLNDIPNDTLLNKAVITHIKIIDVIGTITPEFASYDSQNDIINDPWPTPFSSSGFDLDALGLIHVNGINSIKEITKNIKVYPNPFIDKIVIDIDEDIISIKLISLLGVETTLSNSKELNLRHIHKGVYVLRIETNTNFYVHKVVKK